MKRNQFLTILSVILWGISLLLAFIIPPENPYIWLPDALLLMGFWPILYRFKARWLWLVFGLFNVVIGFVLEVGQCLPDANFQFAASALAVKVHLARYHSPLAWILVGFISALIGVALAIITWARRLAAKSKRKSN